MGKGLNSVDAARFTRLLTFRSIFNTFDDWRRDNYEALNGSAFQYLRVYALEG